jgi:hypothetical protein
LRRYDGIDPNVASNRLHKIKDESGLAANDDVLIGATGDVYDARTGTRLGSLTDPFDAASSRSRMKLTDQLIGAPRTAPCRVVGVRVALSCAWFI